MEDYLLTNKYKDALLRKLLAGRVDKPDSDLLQTRPEYLQAALDEIPVMAESIRIWSMDLASRRSRERRKAGDDVFDLRRDDLHAAINQR
jgi:hypothetical protein